MILPLQVPNGNACKLLLGLSFAPGPETSLLRHYKPFINKALFWPFNFYSQADPAYIDCEVQEKKSCL
tara:strand:- start:3148 stop:3351 length:204 start_codon:yes stop_codon:yes gene_type:complete